MGHLLRRREITNFELDGVPSADASHPHKHWNQPRLPGRTVQRRRARRNGMFRPVRRSRYVAGGSMPDVPRLLAITNPATYVRTRLAAGRVRKGATR